MSWADVPPHIRIGSYRKPQGTVEVDVNVPAEMILSFSLTRGDKESDTIVVRGPYQGHIMFEQKD